MSRYVCGSCTVNFLTEHYCPDHQWSETPVACHLSFGSWHPASGIWIVLTFRFKKWNRLRARAPWISSFARIDKTIELDNDGVVVASTERGTTAFAEPLRLDCAPRTWFESLSVEQLPQSLEEELL